MSSLPQCPSCGDQFRPGIVECPDCGVPLAAPSDPGSEQSGSGHPESHEAGSDRPGVGSTQPSSRPTGGDAPVEAPDEEPVPDQGDEAPAMVDLHELSDPERRLVAQLLNGRRVRHSWQGGSVVVPARVVPEVELAVEQALQAGRPVLDAAVPSTVYEVGAWPAAVQAKLAGLLEGEAVAYEWDTNGDLVVASSDEEVVDALFDAIDESELAGGPDPLPLLEAVHADLARLTRDPGDDRARQGVVDVADDLAGADPPFGFDPPVWRQLIEVVTSLADDLDQLDGEDVRLRSSQAREELRRWL
jgi:hypothetical protein